MLKSIKSIRATVRREINATRTVIHLGGGAAALLSFETLVNRAKRNRLINDIAVAIAFSRYSI